jgi:hypothetical protein
MRSLAGVAVLHGLLAACSSSLPEVDTSLDCEQEDYEFQIFQPMEGPPCPPIEGMDPQCANWFSFGDSAPDSETAITLLPVDRCDSTAALVMTSRRHTDWGGGFGDYDITMATQVEAAIPPNSMNPNGLPALSTGFDASGYEGVSFWARATGYGTSTGFVFNLNDHNTHPNGRICQEPVVDPNATTGYTVNEAGMTVPIGGEIAGPNDCGNVFSRVVVAERTWTLHLLPFNSFRQIAQPNIEPAGFDASGLMQFSINIPKDSNIELWIDDLGVYRRRAANNPAP